MIEVNVLFIVECDECSASISKAFDEIGKAIQAATDLGWSVSCSPGGVNVICAECQ